MSNPVVERAYKSLDDLNKAHPSDAIDLSALMQGYANNSGNGSADQKRQALALLMRLQGNGHISAWAAANFRAYFAQSPSALQAAGIGPPPSIPTPGDNLKSIGSAVKAIDWGGFLSALSNANTWIRVAEVLVGVLLIAVGVAQLTHAVPIATKIAKAVK